MIEKGINIVLCGREFDISYGPGCCEGGQCGDTGSGHPVEEELALAGVLFPFHILKSYLLSES